ncbi:MAG: multicopper oxidase family protein [Kofleriaceae bacterium]
MLPLGVGSCGDDPVIPDGGGTFPVPPLLDGDLEGNVRVFRLGIEPGEVEWVPGAPTATYGVNGAYLGPTLRFRRGERVRLEVTNSLGETTTLHWHGVELPARADGGPYQPIAPDTTWVSEYDVIQRPMTAWYHAHPMHSTGRHVYMGLAGMIVVEDPAAMLVLPSTYGFDDLAVVIQDRRLFADGTHPYSPGKSPSMHDHMAGLRGETLLVNGQIRPTGVVPRGVIRLRLLNGSNARIYNLGFSDERTFLHIASDGGLLEAPIATTRVVVAPGERAEILVDFGADPSGATVQLQSFSAEIFAALFTGMMGANLSDDLDRSTFEIMTFEVGAQSTNAMMPPERFEPIVRMLESEAVRTRPIALSMGQGRVAINGVRMTQLGSVPAEINFQIRSGETELWQVTNTSGMAHPFHVHNRHFQVLDIDGQPPPLGLAGWKDTVLVRPGQAVRLLLKFEGTADLEFPYLFHCHILEHEDMGMMGQFFIIAA